MLQQPDLLILWSAIPKPLFTLDKHDAGEQCSSCNPAEESALPIQGAHTVLTQLLHHPATIALPSHLPCQEETLRKEAQRHKSAQLGKLMCFIKVSSGF